MKKPEIDAQAVVATGAVVLGDVTIKKDASIWYNAVVRGDSSEIQIGEGTNVQDLCVLHVDENCPLNIGRNVTVGPCCDSSWLHHWRRRFDRYGSYYSERGSSRKEQYGGSRSFGHIEYSDPGWSTLYGKSCKIQENAVR